MKSVRRWLFFLLVVIILIFTGFNYSNEVSEEDQNFYKSGIVWFNETKVDLASWQRMSIDEILDEIDSTGIMFTKLNYIEEPYTPMDGSNHSRTDVEVVKNTFHANRKGAIHMALGKDEDDYRSSFVYYNYDGERLFFSFTEKKDTESGRYRIGEQALTCSELIDIGMDRIPEETGLFQKYDETDDAVSPDTKRLELFNENRSMYIECVVDSESVRYEFAWFDKKLK